LKSEIRKAILNAPMQANINYPRLNSWTNTFSTFVELKSGISFHSFASNPYTEEQEGYKYKVYENARSNLGFAKWSQADIGSGKIARAVIDAIEIKDNNLFQWQPIRGEARRPHQPLYVALEEGARLEELESTLFNLFHTWNEQENIEALLRAFRKKYGLIAYLFFIKDRTQFLPLAPTIFDDSFHLLSIDFKTSHKCSWANYRQFLNLVGEIRNFLSLRFSGEVSLLDAHSFVYMLSRQMARENFSPDSLSSINPSIPETEREAIVKSRIGQGRFRTDLLVYWEGCAVTGFRDTRVLRASHLKPWAESNDRERLDPFNGLLLTPNLDTCLDQGLISFERTGRIILSKQLSKEEWMKLGIEADQRLAKLDDRHENYLSHHREEIFRD
jgi:hypothetical protein